MKNRTGLWLAAIYLALAIVTLAQAPPDAKQEIERLEEQARQAALKGDTGFVEKYTAPDYIGITAPWDLPHKSRGNRDPANGKGHLSGDRRARAEDTHLR